MKARAFSFSALDSFCSCPRKYHEESVLKSTPQEETEAMRLGTWTHKMFEERLDPKRRIPLVSKLSMHEPFMAELEGHGGVIRTEYKAALNTKLQPVGFFDPGVWWRGIMDVDQRFPGTGFARHVDYKTGKPHNKVLQLQLGGLYMMQTDPSITEVECMFYWTKTCTRTRFTMTRKQIPVILAGMMPDLLRFKTAFNDEVFPATPNGLCREYCAVTGCEFHGRGRSRR